MTVNNEAAEHAAGAILDLFLPFIDRGPDGYREAEARLDERMRKAQPVINLIVAALSEERRLAALPPSAPAVLDVDRLGLSDEQTRNLRQHLIARQQTLGEWIGDVLFDYRMGRPDGIEYPSAARLDEAVRPMKVSGNEMPWRNR